jgi:hypothetical protein
MKDILGGSLMEYLRVYAIDIDNFKREIRNIIDGLSESKFVSILWFTLQHSIKAVIVSKKIGLKKAGKAFVKLGKGMYGFLKDEVVTATGDFKHYFKSLPKRVGNASVELGEDLVEYIKDRVACFKQLTMGEKKDLIMSGIVWTAAVLVAGGGVDMEGGVPDLDTEIGGIGAHRNVFSHSILFPLTLEFLIRVIVNLSREGRVNLSSKKGPIWSAVNQAALLLDKNEDSVVSGLWFGVALHLMKDASLLSDGVKPYVGIPVHMTEEAHKAAFAGNSFLSFIFSKNKESVNRSM